ncbi:sulfotransferase [Sinorhizobium fredii]|uniref:Sulfotransferase n=1 Tax=Rhizobium fredii TaxID=380 RepID=A0A2A6M720_RHIFR|nr:sulfotransferase [Sinorhizobium fredii]PDT50408.1 sulfotransferase [Sinorhizobium fredii]
MTVGLKPNLFVIGASKTGSSALHAYLDVHPAIQMSRPKEPCFFVEREQLKRMWPVQAHNKVSYELSAYLAMFDDQSARYHGEASVYYSQYPHIDGVARRIYDFNPEARIVYLVRDPVTRTIRHYWQRAKELFEPLPLDEAVVEGSIYVDASDYKLQVDQYLNYFDRSSICVVSSEDLRVSRRETLGAILGWLDLPPFEFAESDLTDRHVSPSTSRRARFALARSIRDSATWASVRPLVPKLVRSALARAGTATFERASVDDTAVRKWLADYFRPRVAEFEIFCGRKFPGWLRSKPVNY